MTHLVTYENAKAACLLFATLYFTSYGADALKDSHTLAAKVANYITPTWITENIKEFKINISKQKEMMVSYICKKKVPAKPAVYRRETPHIAFDLVVNTLVCAVGLSVFSRLASPQVYNKSLQIANKGLAYLLSPLRIETHTPLEVITGMIRSAKN